MKCEFWPGCQLTILTGLLTKLELFCSEYFLLFNFMRFWKSINTTLQRNGLFLAVLKHQQWTIVSTEAQVQHRGLDEVHQNRRILHEVRQTVFLIRIWNMVQLSLKGHLLRQIRKMECFWSYRVTHGTCDPFWLWLSWVGFTFYKSFKGMIIT